MRRAVYRQSRGGGRPHRRTTDSNTMCRTSPVFALRPEKSCLERERELWRREASSGRQQTTTQCAEHPPSIRFACREELYIEIYAEEGGQPLTDNNTMSRTSPQRSPCVPRRAVGRELWRREASPGRQQTTTECPEHPPNVRLACREEL